MRWHQLTLLIGSSTLKTRVWDRNERLWEAQVHQPGSPLSAAADDWSSDTELLIALFLKGLDTLQVLPSSETKCQAKHLHEWRNVAQQSASSVLLLSAHEHEELTAWGSSVAVCIQVDELLAVVTCKLQFDSHTLPVYTKGGGWSRKLWRQSYNMRFLDTYSSATITPYGKRRLPPGGERFDFACFSCYQEILHYLNNYFWLLMQ